MYKTFKIRYKHKIIFILLLNIFYYKVYSQNYYELLENNIEYFKTHNSYYSKYNNLKLFYYIDNKNISIITHEKITENLNRLKQYINADQEFNIIIYYNIHEFINSNIIEYKIPNIQQTNFKVSSTKNTICLYIDDIEDFNYYSILKKSLLLLNINNYIKINKINSTLYQNTSFINAYIESTEINDSVQYYSNLNSLQKFILINKNNIPQNNIIDSIYKSSIYLSIILNEIKIKYGWYKHYLLSLQDYSKLSYDEIFYKTYSISLKNEIELFVENTYNNTILESNAMDNQYINNNIINTLSKKDLLRYNGLYNSYYYKGLNPILVPFKKGYKLIIYDSTMVMFEYYIDYENDINIFQLLSPNKLLIYSNNSLILYNIKDKNKKILINDLNNILNNNIIKFLCTDFTSNKYELFFLLKNDKNLLNIKKLTINNSNKNNEIKIENYNSNINYYKSYNSIYKLNNDSIFIIHQHNNHKDSIFLTKNINCQKCQIENNINNDTITINKNDYSLSQPLIIKDKYKFVENSNFNSQVKKYNLYITNNFENSLFTIDDKIKYYPMFETNGEYINNFPSASPTINILDIYNNKQLQIGFKLPINMEGSDFNIKYSNYVKRLNWNLEYSRVVKYLNINSSKFQLDSFLNLVPNQRKILYHNIKINLNYPLRKFWNIYIKNSINLFNTKFISIDDYSLKYNDTINIMYVSDIYLSKIIFNNKSKHNFNLGFVTFINKETNNHYSNITVFYGSIKNEISKNNINFVNKLDFKRNLSKSKVLFNIGGVEGNIFPLIDTNYNIQFENKYKYQNFVNTFRGSENNILYAQDYILSNFEYNYSLKNVYKNKLKYLDNFYIGFFIDNLLMKGINQKFYYNLAVGPLIKYNINKSSQIVYSYNIYGTNKIWYISLININ